MKLYQKCKFDIVEVAVLSTFIGNRIRALVAKLEFMDESDDLFISTKHELAALERIYVKLNPPDKCHNDR